MDQISEKISFGLGRNDGFSVDHPIIDRIRTADFAPQRQLADMAANQLGTVGTGNHYVDLFKDENGIIWIGVHFGSRGFGHKTANGFLSIAQGGKFEDQAKDGEMEAPPTLFELDSESGQAYLSAMTLAGEYAFAGREVVVDRVLDILGAKQLEAVHNYHNYSWEEEIGGEKFHVVRKGCTPAYPGQKGFVGSTMGEASVILQGSGDNSAGLFSTVHGAGRAMSRNEAAGKRRHRFSCTNCGWFQGPGVHPPKDKLCPKCNKKTKRRPVQMSKGKIDFDSAKEELALKGIELRGGDADEAPGAYKRLDQVLAAHGDTIQVLHRLEPIGVAMAPPDTFDPFKD
jgi:tRNA-splicing ligase RtcB